MDPVSLAVGVIGLAGLFTTCLDLAEKIDDYKHFKGDERALAAQFVSHKLRFEKWGKALGLDQTASNLSRDRHEALDDVETLDTVRKIFDIIREILSDQRGSSSSRPATNPSRLARSLTEPFRITPGSKREKLAWALKGKGKREDQVELFGKLVQHLYHLVPIESITRTATIANGGQTPDPTVQIDPQPVIDNSAWTAEIRDTLQKIEGKAQVEARRELHAWIVRHPPNEIYEDATQRRLGETCGWILQRPVLHEWLSLPQGPEASRVLWINGPAGFGKTVLCTRIVQHLLQEVKTPVAHFFFSSDFESRDDPYEAIRCWISEVISRSQTAFDYVRMKREMQHEVAATRTFILQLFSEIVRIVPGCVFVIDGLDECTWLSRGSNPGRGDSISSFLEKLDRAVASSATRVLIVSRDEPEIRSGVENMQSTIFEYNILPEDVESDVKRFSRSIVDRKLSKKSESFRNDISEKMAQKCGGQFLWLKLQEDSLRSWKNQKQLQDTIEKTPSGIDSLYHRNWVRLSQLPEEERVRAFSLLRWAAFAMRPLTIAEIAEAALIDLESDELPMDELPDVVDFDYVNSEIIGVCGSLISIRKSSTGLDPRLSTIRLTHFSVKEYFLAHSPSTGDILRVNEKLRSSNERIENITLAQLCLRYIHYEQIWEIDCNQDSDQIQGSFKEYASRNWYNHAHRGSLEDSLIQELMSSLFDIDGGAWKSWKQWFDSDQRELMEFYVNTDDDEHDKKRKQESLAKSMPHSPVFYASFLDLTQVTLKLIAEYPDHLDEMSFMRETALSYACRNMNDTIAQALIQAGADIGVKNYTGATPLHWAADKGSLSLARLLLESGAESTAPDHKHSTPLHFAAYGGHVSIAELLLQYGAAIEAQDYHGATPFYQAAVRGNLDVMKLLIRKGVAIETITDRHGQTPLHVAAVNGQAESAKLLLDNGANINVVDNHTCTPLISAAFFGFTELVRSFLSRGADIDARDIWGHTALIVAAGHNHIDTTQLLLDNGADAALMDAIGWNALVGASFEGSVETTRLLLTLGIDASSIDEDGCDALYYAADGGHAEVTKLLLNYGADLAVAGSNKRSSLRAAISKGHVDVVQVLFDNGAAHDSCIGDGWLPLPWASSEGQIKIAELLLGLGAEFTDSGDNGLTPLSAATIGNKTEMVRFLLERGAKSTATTHDKDGDTPLLSAIYRGNTDIVELLLDHGVDGNHKDGQGQRPLSLAARIGHLDIMQLLLESGCDITATDDDSWTPLHSAACNGQGDAVNFLLQRGANLSASDDSGKTALHLASQNGHIKVVDALLKLAGPDDVVRTDNHLRTPLFYAAMRGHSDLLKLLLSKTTKIHTEDRYGSTALFAAIRNGHEDVVEQLLAVGEISIGSKDAFGKTMSFWAQKSGNVRVTDLLKPYTQQEDPEIDPQIDPEIDLEIDPEIHDGSETVAIQTGRLFDSQAYWCDVCTRCIPKDSEYFQCSKCECDGGDFIACEECVIMGAKCLDKSHEWTAAVEQIDSSSDEEA